MSPAVEYFVRPDVNRMFTLRAEGDTDSRFGCTGFGSLFSHKNRVADVGYLQRYVHQSFAVTLLVVVLVQLVRAECDEREVVFGIDTHLAVERVSREAHAVSGVLVEDGVMDSILVDTGSEQRGRHLEYLRTAGTIGEIAGIGHQTGVETCGDVIV